MKSILTIDNLSKIYKSGERDLKVLDDISFDLNEGVTKLRFSIESLASGVYLARMHVSSQYMKEVRLIKIR